MAIRILLVPLDGSDSSKTAMAAAGALARDLPAHLDVLHVRADPETANPQHIDNLSGATLDEFIKFAGWATDQRAAKSRKAFDDFCASESIPVVEGPPPPGGVTASWVEEVGRADRMLARRGRVVDMIVLARPSADSSAFTKMTLNAALFETGRPVLAIPPKPLATIGQSIAIAWNGSAEGSRAVAASLPLIERAKKVFVMTAETSHTSKDNAEGLITYLAGHGIDAQKRIIPKTVEAPVGRTLLEECEDVDADMMVMGAFSHNRMRDLILGGVTRHVLGEALVPILMAK
jgi:nucleotide-binding universal stress UspA family protein